MLLRFSLALLCLYQVHSFENALRFRRAVDSCPLAPRNNRTEEELMKGLENITDSFQVTIVTSLKESGDLIDQIDSIRASQQAVLIAENLCQVAALTPEVSLVSDLMPTEQFKLLRTPKSFRGSLIQMVDNMCDSFITADSAMTRVKLNLVSLPTVLGSTVKLLSSSDTTQKAFLLNLNLKKIKKASEVCASETDNVAKKFQGTIDLVGELVLGCTTCESNSKMEKAKKEQLKIQLEGEAAVEKEYGEKIKQDEEEMRKNVKDTLAKYDKQVKRMGSLGYLFGAAIIDLVSGFGRAVVSIIGGGRQQSGAGSISEVSQSNQASRFWTKMIDTFTANGDKSKKDQVTAWWKACLESPMGKALPGVVSKAQQMIAALEAENDSEPGWEGKVNAQVDDLKSVVPPPQESSGGGPSGGGSKSAKETLEKSVEELRMRYEFQTRQAEVLREKLLQNRLRMNTLMSQMATINWETANLAEIIEYLQKGLQLLNDAKDVWNSMARFFRTFNNMAFDVLSRNIDRFTEIAKQQAATNESKILEDEILETAVGLTATCTAMHFCAETYAETSRKYIMPTITAVGKNLQLSKEEAQRRLKETPVRTSGQLCEMTKYLSGRIETVVDFSKKRAVDFIKKYKN